MRHTMEDVRSKAGELEFEEMRVKTFRRIECVQHYWSKGGNRRNEEHLYIKKRSFWSSPLSVDNKRCACTVRRRVYNSSFCKKKTDSQSDDRQRHTHNSGDRDQDPLCPGGDMTQRMRSDPVHRYMRKALNREQHPFIRFFFRLYIVVRWSSFICT